jgi:hypothetical protein
MKDKKRVCVTWLHEFCKAGVLVVLLRGSYNHGQHPRNFRLN